MPTSIAIWSDNELKRLREYAENNIIPLEQMEKLSKGEPAPIPGDNEEAIMLIAPNYRVVFSLEEHPKGVLRHMSVSSSDNKAMPIEFLELICSQLGFSSLDNCYKFLESFGDGTLEALNIIEPIDGNWDAHKKTTEGEDNHDYIQ